MSKRATKKEQEIRVNHAANLEAECQSFITFSIFNNIIYIFTGDSF